MKAIDQIPRGRQVPHRLGNERPGDGAPVFGRASGAVMPVAEEPFHRHKVESDNETPVLLVQRAHLIGERREKFALKPVPYICYG